MSSQARFRVYIDGVLVYNPDGGVNEPQGILETELKIVRDEKLKGVFFEFVSDLTFWKSAYEYLKTVAINNDDCVSPDVVIEYQCANDSGYEVLFEGKIPLGSEDVEWDDFLCNVKTKVENADFSNFLQTYGDFKVKINNTTTIDGSTALTPINSNDTELFNGFLGGLTGTGIRTYDFIPALQQVLSYLSNNDILLSADSLYATLYQPQVITATLTPGVGTLQIEWVNFFNQEMRTILTTGTEAVAATLHLNQSSGPAYEDRSNDFAKASNATIIGNTITITNYLPWKSFTFTYAPGVVVVEQPFVYGLKNLAFTTTTTIQEQYNDIYVSLNDLLIHAAQFSNMGYQLIKTGTNYQFNLRKVEDLFDDSGTALQLSNIRNIKHKSSGQYNLVNLTTPSGKADEVFQEQTYNTGNCFGDSLKVAGKNYSSQEFFDTIVSTQTQDDELMFLFLKEGDYTLAEMFPFRQQILDGGGRPNFSDEYYHYNAPYFQALIAERYNINNGLKTYKTEITLPVLPQPDNFAECDTCPVAFITNDQVLDLRRLYTFECPLSYAQIKSIRDNSLQLITFSDNLGVTKHGFLKEVTIPFKDFIAKFEVYSDK